MFICSVNIFSFHFFDFRLMYYYLKGEIVSIFQDSIVIDVSGVGYQVLMSHPDYFTVGQLATVYISYIVREDEQYFVGFSTLKEKEFFNKLIGCKGIGPKTALTALKDISLDDFINAIMTSDVKTLKKLSGIGPKAASQIILDLQGVLKINDVEKEKFTPAQEDAKLALKNLGFKVKDIEECLKIINDDTLSTEQYITQVLKIKGGRK